MFEINGINVGYGDVQIIYDLSLNIEVGEIVSLVGSNGAGKTTVMRTISGLMRPFSGEIIFNGRRIHLLMPAEIVNLGVSHVPEGRNLFGSMSVEHNLELGAVREKASKNKAVNMKGVFDLFPILAARKKQLAWSLSGGEQQMLAIGRSLMSEPELLIMDEPTLGLSPLLVKTIFSTIATIRDEGTTVLLVEQNLIQALKTSDRGYILETGRIVQSGSGAELLEDEHIRKSYLGI